MYNCALNQIKAKNKKNENTHSFSLSCEQENQEIRSFALVKKRSKLPLLRAITRRSSEEIVFFNKLEKEASNPLLIGSSLSSSSSLSF